jgi:hypothetical protein
MTCEQNDAALSEYVDGARPEGLEAHLAVCPRCRAVVEDLRTLRAAARALEPRVPPAHVWTRIVEEIDGPARAGAARRVASAFRRKELALAAMLVLILGAATWFAWRQLNTPSAGTTIAQPVETPEPDPALVQDVETQLKLAEEHYVRAIAGLEAIASAEGSELDQETADVLRANLTVIDDAIGESRAALQTEPANALAQRSLFEALRSKVTLLQDTIALINEMRKGNQEGAARIVNGLNP